MTISAFRTVVWQPGKASVWPSKRPLSVLDYSLDVEAGLDLGDSIASVTTSAQQPGLLVLSAANAGTVCTVNLTAGLAAATYWIGIVVNTTLGRTLEFPVQISIRADAAPYPTSPLMLSAGAYWYAAPAGTFLEVPIWSAIGTTAGAALDGFWNDAGTLSVPAGSTILASSPVGLAVGDLWTNAGVVTANGNPGLPTAAGAAGSLYYNSGLIGIS